MHGNRRVTREVQAPSRKKSCPDETPEQQQRHREIAQRYGRKKLNKRGGRRLSVLAFRIADLEKFYRAVYGEIMPDNDHRALDHLVVLLHHVAALGDPHAVRACAARWAPWLTHGEYAAIVAEIEQKPLRWRADSLGRQIGLNDAVRTLLKIKTIGANDITKAQRIKRRRKQNNAAKRLSRAKAGANSQATSAEQLKPWLALGVSRRTFYRQRANGTVGTVSGTITLSIDGGQSSANRGAPRARARLRGEKELQTSRMVRANASNRIH